MTGNDHRTILQIIVRLTIIAWKIHQIVIEDVQLIVEDENVPILTTQIVHEPFHDLGLGHGSVQCVDGPVAVVQLVFKGNFCLFSLIVCF